MEIAINPCAAAVDDAAATDAAASAADAAAHDAAVAEKAQGGGRRSGQQLAELRDNFAGGRENGWGRLAISKG